MSSATPSTARPPHALNGCVQRLLAVHDAAAPSLPRSRARCRRQAGRVAGRFLTRVSPAEREHRSPLSGGARHRGSNSSQTNEAERLNTGPDVSVIPPARVDTPADTGEALEPNVVGS